MELSRRAGCLERTTDAIAGHAGRDAQTNRRYGGFPDDARKREIQKIWDLVQSITGADAPETLLATTAGSDAVVTDSYPLAGQDCLGGTRTHI